jgi:hypothetical protein
VNPSRAPKAIYLVETGNQGSSLRSE